MDVSEVPLRNPELVDGSYFSIRVLPRSLPWKAPLARGPKEVELLAEAGA